MFFRCFDCFKSTIEAIFKTLKPLKRMKRKSRAIKIILLGPGDSGKSTFLKQVRFINGGKMSKSELEDASIVVYCNVIRAVQVLYDLAVKLSIPLSDPSNHILGLELKNLNCGVPEETFRSYFQKYVPTMRKLLSDSGLKTALSYRNDLFMANTVEYFVKNFERISEPNYVATFNDALRSRNITRGPSEYSCKIKRVPFLFLDLGGQRTQRRIWSTCYEGATAVIFMVASGDFDKEIVEDHKTNTVNESLNILMTILQNPLLKDCTLIVNFSKEDILAEKIRTKNIDEYLNDFSGDPRNLCHVKRYYIQLFRSVIPSSYTPYFFFTNSLDRNNTKKTFDAIKHVVLNDNMKKLLSE